MTAEIRSGQTHRMKRNPHGIRVTPHWLWVIDSEGHKRQVGMVTGNRQPPQWMQLVAFRINKGDPAMIAAIVERALMNKPLDLAAFKRLAKVPEGQEVL